MPVSPGQRLAVVAARGDTRKTLEAMRDRLILDVMAADAEVVAQIAGRLQAVLADLDTPPDEVRRILTDMRDKLAADFDRAPTAVVAQIAGRLQAVLAELDALPDPSKVSPLDAIRNRRAGTDRGSTAEVRQPPRRQTRERRPRSG